MTPLRISPQASQDLLHIADFLEGASGISFLGDHFLTAAASTLRILETHPLAGEQRLFVSRRLVSMRYLVIDAPFDKYLIFCQALPDLTLIVRVLHGAQDLDRILTV